VAIVSDADGQDAPITDLPSPTTAGALEVAKDKDGKPLPEGQDPEEKEPPFQRTGWAPKLGWPHEDVQEGDSLLDHSTWLEGRIPDKFYGGMRIFQLIHCPQELTGTQIGTTTLPLLSLRVLLLGSSLSLGAG
jgi:hypothetical protein